MNRPGTGRSGEFARIDRFLSIFRREGVRTEGLDAGIVIGPGDDCAVLRPGTATELCVTTDALVEDVHFTRAAFSPSDIGHKALAVNLSDLASMGADPTWFVCALALPDSIGTRELDGIARGMAKLARTAGIALVGGNFTRARELSLTLTVAGELPRGHALGRGGHPGDRLFVSGTLGDARLGLERLRQDPRARGPEVARQRRPMPRLVLGRLARRHASAAIDLSDGLSQDVGHLCGASGVGAIIRLASLPLSAAVKKAWGPRAAFEAAIGGEDYELLLAVPPRSVNALRNACAQAGEQVTEIGELTADRSIVLFDAEGQAVERPGGFDHFRGQGR